jgi:hypothetical protein
MLAPGSIVVTGDVSVHHDGDQHWAVILDIQGDECEALFFTSNPLWAEKTRRATKSEIAMAGFVTSRPTYLAYVVRSIWDFSPRGYRFPDHWIETLRQEFRPVQRIVQTEG